VSHQSLASFDFLITVILMYLITVLICISPMISKLCWKWSHTPLAICTSSLGNYLSPLLVFNCHLGGIFCYWVTWVPYIFWI
jgi:hypothetical protein